MKKYNSCCLDTVNTYTNNILKIASLLSTKEAKEITENGLNWYKEAKKLCKQIGKNTGLNYKLVASVFAVLSPNQNWQVQQKFTESFIIGVLKNKDFKSVGYGYYTNRLKAAKIIKEQKIYPYLSGMKVTAFYENIVGNYNTCTLDLWAIRIALNKPELSKSKCGFYMRDFCKRDEIIKAYHKAANMLNIPVAKLQSLTWHIVRNKLV